MLAYIWAEGNNHVIGKDGKLPWHLPDDMKFFKDNTINHKIVAGKRTFNSFGRPLPKRQNLVITHTDQSEFPEGVLTFKDVSSFMEYGDKHKNEMIFVVGGRSIYKALLPYVDYLYRTTIDHDFVGDTEMVDIDYSDFELVKTLPGKVDDKNKYNHHFDILKRK